MSYTHIIIIAAAIVLAVADLYLAGRTWLALRRIRREVLAERIGRRLGEVI